MSKRIKFLINDGSIEHGYIAAPTRTAALAEAEAIWMRNNRWKNELPKEVADTITMPSFTAKKMASDSGLYTPPML